MSWKWQKQNVTPATVFGSQVLVRSKPKTRYKTGHLSYEFDCILYEKVFCEKTDLKSRLEIKQAAFQQELKHSEQTRELITTFYIPEQLTVKSCKSFISVSVLFSWLFIPFLLENSSFTQKFGQNLPYLAIFDVSSGLSRGLL